MKYTVSRSSHEKAYLQLYRQIREDIVSGVLPYGTRLPSKRLVAEETGTSVITAAHAYDILADEGYIEMRQRSGCFVSYREHDSFPVGGNSVPVQVPAVRRGTAEDFPFSVYARTMRKVISLYGERLLERSPDPGCERLREAVSSYLARSRGVSAPPGRIVIGAGAEYIYGLIIQTLGRDLVYGLEDPSFEKISKVCAASGVTAEFLKMGPDGILTGELARSRAQVLHVTPFHSYPSGITASASKRGEYIRWAAERGAVIIEDDYDSEFSSLAKTEDTLYSLSGGRGVIYVNSFSKSISPALRAGYMILPESLYGEYKKRAGFYSCPVPIFEQYVIAELLDSGDFERHINRVRRMRRRADQSASSVSSQTWISGMVSGSAPL